MECYKFCFVFLLRRKLKPHFFLQKCEISQMLFSVQDEKYGLEPALLVWKHCLLSAFNLFCTFLKKHKTFPSSFIWSPLSFFFIQLSNFATFICAAKSSSLLLSSCWCEKQYGAMSISHRLTAKTAFDQIDWTEKDFPRSFEVWCCHFFWKSTVGKEETHVHKQVYIIGEYLKEYCANKCF